MVSKDEQETTVTGTRGDEHWFIYSANPVHLRKLRKEPRAVEWSGAADWANFIVKQADYNPMSGFKRKSKPMTPEQRQAASDRLKKAREQGGKN